MTVLESLRKLPKVQLHCHLEGSVRAETFAELAAKYRVPTEYRPDGAESDTAPPAADSIYHFVGFKEFLFKFAAVCRSLQQPNDYARVLREYAQDAADHGVMYAELLVSPPVWRFFHSDLIVDRVFEKLYAAAQQVEAQRGPRIRFICDLTRNFGVKNCIETAQLAVKTKHYGVVALGLGGDEANFPASDFREAFAVAREGGLHGVAHAGEAAGAQSVKDAVEILRAERIGHGVRAVEDRKVLDLLKERNIALEVCPTSNFRTGAAAREKQHPLVDLHKAGVPLMIDSDDPAIFETDITQEYAYAESIAGMDAVLAFAHRAIHASFAETSLKEEMDQKLARASAELFTSRRS